MTAGNVVDGSIRRVVILGSGGAGKSTLARRVADAIGGVHVELDVLAFEGGLHPVSFDELHRRLQEALTAPHWVIEGMHREEMRRFALPVCDLVAWLDTPRHVVGYRLLRRLLIHLARRTERHGRRIGLADVRRELRFVRKTLRKFEQRRQYARELSASATSAGAVTVVVRSEDDIARLLGELAR